MPNARATLAPAAPQRERVRTLRVGKLHWRLRDDISPEALWAVLHDPELHLANRALHLKNEQVVTIARVPSASAQQPNLVLRRLNYGKLRHRLRDFFRSSRAYRALARGWMLQQAGVATPRTLAAAEVRRFRWPLAAYVITEEVPGAKNLSQFLTQRHCLPRSLVLRTADLIARMHNQGFSHRDLKYTNVLLDEQLQPYLIDLDGLRRFRKLSDKHAVGDLVRLARELMAYSQNLKWRGGRFLKHYCRQRRMESSFRPLAIRIVSELQKK